MDVLERRRTIQFTGFVGEIVRAFMGCLNPGYMPVVDQAWTQVRETRSLAVNAANLPRLTAAAQRRWISGGFHPGGSGLTSGEGECSPLRQEIKARARRMRPPVADR
jgi:hypothetical protein